MTKPRTKQCIDCPTMVTATATRCKPCNHTHITYSPEMRAKRAASIARFFRENPGKAHEQAVKSAAARMANPVQAERLRQHMRAVQHLSCTPEEIAKRDGTARRMKQYETTMAWCPPEYRDLYNEVMKSSRVRFSEAKAMILAQIATDKAREERNLSPFERQERALRNGAGLQDNAPITRNSAAAAELRQKLA